MITVARLEFPSRSTPFVKFVGGIGNVQSQVRPENKTNEKSVSIKSKKKLYMHRDGFPHDTHSDTSSRSK